MAKRRRGPLQAKEGPARPAGRWPGGRRCGRVGGPAPPSLCHGLPVFQKTSPLLGRATLSTPYLAEIEEH